MQGLRKPPTIQDVARHAQVSSATVSRALSAPERVTEATRARVADAVRVTGYTINEAARSLRLRRARTILIALPNIGNPFYSTILDAVINEATSRGYGVLVANRLGDDPTLWLRDYFYSNRADGLLLFDASLDLEALHRLPVNRGSMPLVLSCDERPSLPINLVTTDNREAAGRATRHLIELGHRRLGHLSGRPKPGLINERLVGFQDAVSRAGLPLRPDWIFEGDHSMASGVAAAERFLALTERPSAVFCANDESMIGFAATLRKAGVTSPTDISLVGFDDIGIAEHYAPPLTTMRQPRAEMGQAATAALLDLLEGARPPMPLRIVLPSELIVRGSTAPYIGA